MARRPSKNSGARPVGVLRITAPTKRSAAPAASTATKTVTTEDVEKLSIASLTLDTPLRPLVRPRRVPANPFHFLSLPSEIRIRIYEYYFSDSEPVIDLGPENHKRYHNKLRLVRVCRQVHDEATHLFYSTQTFRIFQIYPGRYFKTKKPLLARMKPIHRDCMTSLDLRLGPGWGAPPKGWVVTPALGLHECVNVHRLKVMVECDTSDNIYKGFRRSDGFYEGFCRNLLSDVMDALPNVVEVQFDAWPAVKKSGLMMQGLMSTATEAGMHITWGPERGWTDADEDDRNDTRSGMLLSLDGHPIDVVPWISA